MTPQRAYEIFPITTLIGALVGLGALAARHELVAMRAAGASLFAITRAVLAAGILLAAAAVALGEWVAPPAQQLAQQWRAQTEAGSVAQGPAGGFWVRDERRFMHIERAPSPDVIEGVSAYEVRDHRLVEVIRATRGRWADGAWQLQDVRRLRPTADRIERSQQASLSLGSNVTPATLEVVVLSPQSLPLVDLYTYIRYLEGSGLDSAQYRLAFWVKLAKPLATLTMLLITVPLILGTLRSVGTGQKIFVGVLIGIAFFLGHRLLANAGLVYGLPPALAALAPTAVAFALGVWGLLRVR
jgi:lipopolysaccharide export system permease protein